MASCSGGHKQAQYDHQIYRELQGKARLQAKSYRTTNEFMKVMVVNKINISQNSIHYLDQDGKSARLTSCKLATACRHYIGMPADRTY